MFSILCLILKLKQNLWKAQKKFLTLYFLCILHHMALANKNC